MQRPQYRDRKLYVSIGTLEGQRLANGNKSTFAGKNLLDIKDADGKLFRRERIKIAKEKGAGWQDCKWPDPIIKECQEKSMYVERYEAVMVGCGIYGK